MASTRKIRVLLLADNPASRRQWTKWMKQLPDVLLVDANADECDDPEVVVTDRATVADRMPGDGRQLCTGEIGVIGVGRSAPADVSLPSNVTRRELELACRLLAEIVRLRRRQRTGERQQDELRLLAATDPLTGLANRRGWDRQIPLRLNDRRLRDTPLCMAVFDLDHFKQVNDRDGHACGDAVLREAGRAIVEGVRDDDLPARLGGDEFGLLLRIADLETSQRVVERVRQSIQRRLSDAGLPATSASAGFSIATPSALDDASALFAAADAALRQAKCGGRDRTAFQPPRSC
jgi:diguanylate cyclase (GGDEF)-like protein